MENFLIIKYMINWPIEGNDYYVNLIEMTREEREEALKYAKHYTMCFVYFLQHELGFNTLGLADDEYPTADKLPFIPYHRESRRIHGLVRFDLNHACEPFSSLNLFIVLVLPWGIILWTIIIRVIMDMKSCLIFIFIRYRHTVSFRNFDSERC